jgi:uncharacterized protein (TIGR03437 family)
VCNAATVRILAATLIAAAGLGAQETDWRRVGNAAIDRSLAGLATGPVDRVWYTQTGSLAIRTVSGRVFETADNETWRASTAVPVEPAPGLVSKLPEPGATARNASRAAYAIGRFAYRSVNNGASWDNLTAFRGASLVGDPRDLAISPSNDDEIVIAGSDGVFRSMDGGKSWSSLNQTLPNLTAARLLAVPSGDRGVRLALSDGNVVEWEPGQKLAWAPAEGADLALEIRQRQMLSVDRGAVVTAVANAPGYTYIGMAEGRISVLNNGIARDFQTGGTGMVERFWIDPNDPRIALAVLGASATRGLTAVHVVRTQNGGQFWDDLTGALPDAAAHGITADRATGAIYAATDRGVFLAYTDLQVLGGAPQWKALPGLAAAPAMDVKLDAQANQLWVALDGYGVYATLAPHRMHDPRVVSTADLAARAAAPGSLMSVLGTRIETARAGDVAVPVLTSNETESQLQIPFEARGSSLSLAVDGGRTLPPIALEAAAPAIFVNREDGAPVLLDGDSGVMLDAMNPAHSRSRIQILSTGLGRVNPEWPTGLPAPQENPPQVAATVRAFLDRQSVEVTRAVLAPFIGFYLVEIEVPKIVNFGPAELYLEVDGRASNRVRIYIAP